MTGRAMYAAMRARGCNGYPASDRKVPLLLQLAAERQAHKIAQEMEAQLGVPVLLKAHTHWHLDNSLCLHAGDRAFRITRRQIRERGARKAARG